MTVTQISEEQTCQIGTVVKRLQSGGIFRTQESRKLEDQTVNPTYEGDIVPTSNGDYEWNGNSQTGRAITSIARGN